MSKAFNMSKILCIKKQEVLFYGYFFIISLAQAFGIGASDNPMVIGLTMISLAFFVGKMFSTKYNSKRDIILVVVLVVYAIFTTVTSNNIIFAINIFTILALQNINIEKMLKCLFFYRLCGFLSIISLAQLGFIDDRMKYLFVNGVNTYVIRRSLGFFHPNVLYIYFFVLIIIFVYVYFEKLKLIHFLAMAGLSVGLYYISYSKTGTICTMAFIVIAYILKIKPSFKRLFFNKYFKFVPIFLGIVNVVLAIFYNDNIWFLKKINLIFTGRFGLANSYINEYGLSLFGTEVAPQYIINGKRVVIDSGYIYALISYGVIGFIIMIMAFCLCLNYLYKNNQYLIYTIMLFCILYTVTEQSFLSVLLNFPLLYLGKLIYKENIQKGG